MQAHVIVPGRGVFDTVRFTGGALRLLMDAVVSMRALLKAPVQDVLLRQIYFTGVQALPAVGVIAVLIGFVVVAQVASIAGFNTVLATNVVVWTVIRELGPLIVAMIVIARSTTAVAAEFGTMKQSGEFDALWGMGIDPIAYLVVPRMLGFMVAVAALVFYFGVLAVGGGVFLVSFVMDTRVDQQLTAILRAISIPDLGVSLLKAVVFGAVASSIACFHGLRVGESISQIPQVTTAAVMASLLLIGLLDILITGWMLL